MPEYFSYDDDLHYTPDAIVQDQEDSVSTPKEDDRTKKMGSPRNTPLECYGCGATGSYEKFGIPTQCPHCGSYEVHLDQDKDNAESEMVHKGIEDPFGFDDEEWERKLRESMKKQALEEKKSYNSSQDTLWYKRPEASIENSVLEQSNEDIGRGQMGIMDEDSHEGDIGSPIIANKGAKWYSYYDNLNFYSEASVGDDDNPGYETDEEHGASGRDTDDVEEDYDSDYGGLRKRNPKNDATSATLVAMGGIGTIPEGFVNKNTDVHYGDDESFSHLQSKKPSETGISGENSKELDQFDTQWNS